MFQCAFVPVGSIYVGNFELPRRKGGVEGGVFCGHRELRTRVCAEWLLWRRAEPWTPVTVEQLRIVDAYFSGKLSVCLMK